MSVFMTDIAPIFTDPLAETGVDLVFRRFACPACGAGLDGAICRPEDEPEWDVRIG